MRKSVNLHYERGKKKKKKGVGIPKMLCVRSTFAG